MQIYFKLLLIAYCLSPALCASQEIIRFTVFTDLHQDIIPDASLRLHKILDAAHSNRSQFIVQLGDFAIRRKENDSLVSIWKNHYLEKYSVLGNHDLDIGTKQQYIDYIGSKTPYYFFDKGSYRFIILDTNFFINDKGQEIDYANSNYYGKKTDRISKAQLLWIEQLLGDKSKHIFVFSHTPVDGLIRDNESFIELRTILSKAKQNGSQIAAVMSGHHHIDHYIERDGIHYIELNSASYVYVGEAYANRSRYPDSFYQKRNSLQFVVPYKDALYANVSLDAQNKKIFIEGFKSSFIPPSPAELGLPMKVNKITGDSIYYRPIISNMELAY
ncbi:hypothetical protein AwDysgo_16480 [Bacteroidales bacterium]|nr:hypothetical protein AwDysgo_16480 [Bacteroidales bacterium]